MVNSRNDWEKVWESKKKSGGFLDVGDEQPTVKVAERTAKAYRALAGQIPETTVTMADLRRDRKKRTLDSESQRRRVEIEARLRALTNNPFFHKVQFEQVTDTKALRELLLKQAQDSSGAEVSEEVKKLRAEKEGEIKTWEDQLGTLNGQMEELSLAIETTEQAREELKEK